MGQKKSIPPISMHFELRVPSSFVTLLTLKDPVNTYSPKGFICEERENPGLRCISMLVGGTDLLAVTVSVGNSVAVAALA